MRPLFFLLVVLCGAACLASTTPSDRIHQKDIDALVFKAGEMTTGKRVAPRPQMRLTGSKPRGVPEEHMPTRIACKNMGWDGTQANWKCDTELPNYLRLDDIQVQCEGYARPGDPEVLAGSCGLLYSLRVVGPTPEEQERARQQQQRIDRTVESRTAELRIPGESKPKGNDSDDSFKRGAFIAVILLFLVFVVGVIGVFIVVISGADGYVDDSQTPVARPPTPQPHRKPKKTPPEKKVDSEEDDWNKYNDWNKYSDSDDDDRNTSVSKPPPVARSGRRSSRRSRPTRSYRSDPGVSTSHHYHDSGAGDFLTGCLVGGVVSGALNRSSTSRPSTTNNYYSSRPSAPPPPAPDPEPASSSSWGGGSSSWGSSWGGSSTSTSYGGTTSL